MLYHALTCRYAVWRRNALTKQKHKGPLRILVGALLPIALGFVIAKSGFGSRSTAHAVDDVTNSFTRGVQRLKNTAVHGKHSHEQHGHDSQQEPASVTVRPQAEQKGLVEPMPASRSRKFFGIL